MLFQKMKIFVRIILFLVATAAAGRRTSEWMEEGIRTEQPLVNVHLADYGLFGPLEPLNSESYQQEVPLIEGITVIERSFPELDDLLDNIIIYNDDSEDTNSFSNY
ncbi:unnamed protein product [Moneuplotes crassus]|uniref:Uncharacterized protein n=1 Tax=Euplotes crassus TaxID=5936 RepID=A0AAD2D532_EUPCR|nr:unnamed protein product [Moneuplotes crassus]